MDNNLEKAVTLMMARAQELREKGYDWHHAISRADLENWIKAWPDSWGDNLHVLIYGDFDPPQVDLHLSQLGIDIKAVPIEKSSVRSVRCVLKAIVHVEDKSVPAFLDATRRINLLLGAFTLVSWGNCAIGWRPAAHSFLGHRIAAS